ncbi:MAG: DUF4143 domain-containing protein [Acidobacteriota bacterium]
MNIDGLARDAGLPSSTARRWLDLLEVTCLASMVPAYAVSRTTRLIKTPKLHAADSGLACHLCGVASAAALAQSPLLGALFEGYVHHHLVAYASLLSARAQVLYWRTAGGTEVDFVVEMPDRLLPIKVKTSRSLSRSDLKGLEAFLREYPERAPIGVVLYAGSEWQRPARDVLAIPWSSFAAS